MQPGLDFDLVGTYPLHLQRLMAIRPRLEAALHDTEDARRVVVK